MDINKMTDLEKRNKLKELDRQIMNAEMEYNRFKSLQLALKLVINGTYGAFAHPKFVVSNKHIANAITMHGRDVILFMLDHIEEYFYNKWHEDKNIHDLLTETYIGVDKDFNAYMLNKNNEIVYYPEKYSDEYEEKIDKEKEKSAIFNLLKSWNISIDKIEEIENDVIEVDGKEITLKYKRFLHDFSEVKQIDGSVVANREKMDNYDTKFHKEEMIVYGDTDSVASDSIINTNIGEYTIEELYNKNIINGSAGITLKGHESVNTNDKVLNWSENKGLYYAPIKRIIRHKVKKSKWRLKTKSGKEILVTNDHSMIVFRDGIKMEVKPGEILNTDKILSIFKK